MKTIFNICLVVMFAAITAFGQVTPSGGTASAVKLKTSLWVDPNGNNTTGTRGRSDKPFQTITAAKAAASAGDTIVVYAGVYPENNLLKAGVNFTFYPGVTISNNPAGNDAGWGIFDDRPTGPTTNVILGNPILWYSTGTNSNSFAFTGSTTYDPRWDTNSGASTGILWNFGLTNALGCIVTTNAGTVLTGEIGDITYSCFSPSTLPFLPAACINIVNCNYVGLKLGRLINWNSSLPVGATNDFGYIPTANIDTNSFPGTPLVIWLQDQTAAIYWRNGTCNLSGPFIDQFKGYGIWSDNTWPGTGFTLTNEVDGYFKFDEIDSKFYSSANTTNMVTWCEFGLMKTTTNNASGCLSMLGGKNYITALKIQDALGAAVTLNAAGFLWLNAQKISSSSTHSAAVGYIDGVGAGATAYINVQHYEDVGTNTTSGIHNNGSVIHIQGGDLFMQKGIGVQHDSGTTYLEGVNIDTSVNSSSNNLPVKVSASGMIIKGGATLIGPTGANCTSIHATSGQTVTIGMASANTTNSSNITLSPSGGAFFQVNSNVK